MGESLLESKLGVMLVFRCAACGTVMALANIVPFLLTRGAYRTDGVEVAGWPFRCYEFGGIGGFMHLYPWKMAANIMIAVMVSVAAAWAFRHGVLKTVRRWGIWGTRMFRKLRTWGTPHAE